MKAVTLLFSSLAMGTLARLRTHNDAPRADVFTYVPTHPKADNSTWSNTDQIEVTHQHVDWYINWQS